MGTTCTVCTFLFSDLLADRRVMRVNCHQVSDTASGLIWFCLGDKDVMSHGLGLK